MSSCAGCARPDDLALWRRGWRAQPRLPSLPRSETVGRGQPAGAQPIDRAAAGDPRGLQQIWCATPARAARGPRARAHTLPERGVRWRRCKPPRTSAARAGRALAKRGGRRDRRLPPPARPLARAPRRSRRGWAHRGQGISGCDADHGHGALRPAAAGLDKVRRRRRQRQSQLGPLIPPLRPARRRGRAAAWGLRRLPGPPPASSGVTTLPAHAPCARRGRSSWRSLPT